MALTDRAVVLRPEVDRPYAGSPEQLRAPRVEAIDLVRGALLLAITCSHALVNLRPDYDGLRLVAGFVLSGTAGFATVSGLMVGWFTVTKQARFDRVVRRYRIQAMRLLLLLHPLLVVALLVPSSAPTLTFVTRSLFMTDTLAVLFVVVVPLLPRIGARARVYTGVALMVAGALLRAIDAAHPVAQVALDVLDTADPSRSHVLLSSYGLLPMAGMFFIGSWLGEQLARAQQAGAERAFVASVRRVCLWLWVLGCALVAAWLALRSIDHDLARMMYPDYETSLYPFYLATAMWMLTRALGVDPRSRLARLVALLGQHSLAVYVAQYAIVQTLPYLLGMTNTLSPLGWVALCGVAFVLLPLAALHGRVGELLRGRRPRNGVR